MIRPARSRTFRSKAARCALGSALLLVPALAQPRYANADQPEGTARATGVATLGNASAGDALTEADKIFARAKAMWRTQNTAPYVTFSLLERYSWRDRVHDNWWQASYRSSDKALVLQRTIVAEQEQARLKGTPIGLNFRWHHGTGRADNVDTNRDADAFPILDPLIEPDASFGLLRRSGAILSGSSITTPLAIASAAPLVITGLGDPAHPVVLGAATPAAIAANPSPASDSAPDTVAAQAPGSAPNAHATPEVLREVGRVEAIARDYRIALAGIEHLRYGDTYHLTLTPLRDPKRYRLRDLWVATDTFATEQLAIDGLFDGKPYADARWLVSYIPMGDHWYVSQVKTDDTLRFGMDRFVPGLEYDFVQYDFPQDLPPITFERYHY